ncbi:protein FAR1-RELATED SEQUENCE 5-like [Senna tora]|uniref:Protein FAR1-RELATED SEQUENCE 5-like n=1 Tax=Senna tora TaxID=362788 RepID=A0A834WIP6_9FABA|nr:protein FAR1-RELATED SEQUENCE 5-like [Senna tora]
MGLTHVDGIFRIYDFIEDHNHVLQTPKTTHMLASQRKISKVQALEIELAEDSGGVVIFGAALLHDETTSSFKCLFKTFLEVNLQKKPQTIFTDQDQAMAKALHEVMPEVLEVNGVMTIPNQYILKRLTKDDRSGAIKDVNGNKVVEDPDLVGTMRHRQLWPKLVKLALDVSNSEQAFLLDNEAVNQVNFEVPKIYGNQVNFETPQGSGNQMNFEVPQNLGTQFSFTKFLMQAKWKPGNIKKPHKKYEEEKRNVTCNRRHLINLRWKELQWHRHQIGGRALSHGIEGGWEDDETVEEAAVREATEEAAVRGDLMVKILSNLFLSIFIIVMY